MKWPISTWLFTKMDEYWFSSILLHAWKYYSFMLPYRPLEYCCKISGYMESKHFSGCKIKFIGERFRFVWFYISSCTKRNLSIYIVVPYRECNLSSLMGEIFENLSIHYWFNTERCINKDVIKNAYQCPVDLEYAFSIFSHLIKSRSPWMCGT